jgi:hypothetical protein
MNKASYLVMSLAALAMDDLVQARDRTPDGTSSFETLTAARARADEPTRFALHEAAPYDPDAAARLRAERLEHKRAAHKRRYPT